MFEGYRLATPWPGKVKMEAVGLTSFTAKSVIHMLGPTEDLGS